MDLAQGRTADRTTHPGNSDESADGGASYAVTEESAEPLEADALSGLEERIHRAVHVITELRSENESFQTRLRKAQDDLATVITERDEAQQLCDEFQKDNGELENKMRSLNEQLTALRDERKQVKNRIEKLMGQLDLLSAS